MPFAPARFGHYEYKRSAAARPLSPTHLRKLRQEVTPHFGWAGNVL